MFEDTNWTSIVMTSIFFMAFISMMIFGAYFMKREVQISALPPYYHDLGQECKKKTDFYCCASSVRIMAFNTFSPALDGWCPEGTELNRLDCKDSFAWCVPL